MLGTGLLQGLGVTAKNLVGSFHDPKRYTTVEYPEVKEKLPENFRNFPFLVTDKAEDPMGGLRCVACQICEKECPPQCIYIEKSKDKKPDATGKPQLYPAVFAIDTSVCMSCQICVEVCPFDAIKMDQEFEIATADRFHGLLLNREQRTVEMVLEEGSRHAADPAGPYEVTRFERLVLSVASNLQKAYGQDKIAIEVVAFGPGIDLFQFPVNTIRLLFNQSRRKFEGFWRH